MIEPSHDRRFMAAALAIGRYGQGLTAPNPPVGAVLVREGPHGPVIVGAGSTARGGRPHAERLALRQAGEQAAGATCYATLEPCSHFGRTPPCVLGLIAAKVAGVVVAIEDPNPAVAGAGIAALRAAGVEVRTGVRSTEAAYDMRGHMSRMTRRRPYVTLKLAVSANGAIGRFGLEPGRGHLRISGDQSRHKAHLMRAEHDAIAIGIGTLLADDPRLTCRLPGLAQRSPTSIVLDSDARTPLDAALLADAQIPVIIVTAEDAPAARVRALSDAGADIVMVPRVAGRADIEAAFGIIAGRGIGTVMVEGGAVLATTLAEADLLDEAHIIRSNVRLEGDLVRPFGGDAVGALARRLCVKGRSLVGEDTWTHLIR